MSKSKSNKVLGIVIKVSFIVCLILIIGIVIIKINRQSNVEVTAEYIQDKAVAKINKYKYSKLVLNSEYIGEQDIPNICEYILTSNKDGSYRSYSYRDEENDIYQCWEHHGNHYDFYIYDADIDKWVYSELEYEPVSSDTWSVVSNLKDYTILEEPGQWGNDECYILQMMGSSDYWEVIYEELYIRKSDFLPVGIVSYANSKQDKDRVSEIKPGEYEFGTLTEGTETTSEYEELVSIYALEFSNKPLDLFDKPKEFINNKEYNELIGAKESEVDVEANN